MKNQEILQVLEHNLSSLKYNIKKLLEQNRLTDQTENILFEFRREADALDQAISILKWVPEYERMLECTSMKRLTSDQPAGNFETMLNYVFSQEGQAYIRSDGVSEQPMLLTTWIRKQCIAHGCDEFPDGTPEEIDQMICDCALDYSDCPLFLTYTFACQAVHMRDRCKVYEDVLQMLKNQVGEENANDQGNAGAAQADGGAGSAPLPGLRV